VSGPARAFALLLLLAGCPPLGAPCSSDAGCDERAACKRGRCQEVECRSNTHCPLETTCNPDTYTCDPGCLSSQDCLVGDRCDITAGVCLPRSCTDTQLDCAFGQRCNLATGACEEDTTKNCDRCSDDGDCLPDGLCGQVEAIGRPRCFMPCTPESFDPCPSGMQCTRTSEEDFRCVGFCDGL
jgi:hypothetical protein